MASDPKEVAVSVALARMTEADSVPARIAGMPGALETALLEFLQSKTTVVGVPIERRLFLTLAEAAEYSGLPVAFLRRLMATGKLKALKTGSGWRVSRAELEKTAGGVTETPISLTEHELRDMELNRKRRQGITPPVEHTGSWPE